MKIVKYMSIICVLPIFLGTWATMLWLGISMLVPRTPFYERDIPTGVCLIVFALIIGIIAGSVSFAIIFCFCWVLNRYFACCQDRLQIV